MTDPHHYFKTAVGVLVIALIAMILVKKNNTTDLLPVSLKSIQTAAGWGYEITVDGKTFIHQEFIPAIAGQVSFKDKEQALLVGRYAMQKLTAGKMPVITVEELKKWDIITAADVAKQ